MELISIWWWKLIRHMSSHTCTCAFFNHKELPSINSRIKATLLSSYIPNHSGDISWEQKTSHIESETFNQPYFFCKMRPKWPSIIPQPHVYFDWFHGESGTKNYTMVTKRISHTLISLKQFSFLIVRQQIHSIVQFE